MTKYTVTIEMDDEAETGTALFREEGDETRITQDMWIAQDRIIGDWIVTDGIDTGLCSTWEAAKAAFLEAVAQQVMLDSARKTEVTR